MKLKESKYNFFFPYSNNKILAYNCFTSALAFIAEEDYKKYHKFTNNEGILDEKLKQDLTFGGFLIPENMDEREYLREYIFEKRYDRRHLSLTIAPTMQCNFNCPYCFEQNKKSGKMTKDIQKEVIKLIEEQAKTLKSLGIVWFGGEPLLGIDIISNISSEILALSKKHNIEFKASIVTNGYLLTPDVTQKLKESNINSIQVTIDGPPEIHNSRRILHNGKPTFDQIIKNIKEVCELIPTAIRVNVDQNNLDRCDELIQIFSREGFNDKVHLYFAAVQAFNDDSLLPNCFSTEVFSSENMILRELLIKHSFRAFPYPRVKHNFCCADRINSYVIDSEGYQYKCWSDIGNYSKSIGQLGNNPSKLETYRCRDVLNQYMLFDPTTDPKCSQCNILPLCLGGCPFKRIHGQDRCDEIKFELDKILKNIVDYEIYKTINNK